MLARGEISTATSLLFCSDFLFSIFEVNYSASQLQYVKLTSLVHDMALGDTVVHFAYKD